MCESLIVYSGNFVCGARINKLIYYKEVSSVFLLFTSHVIKVKPSVIAS